MAGLKSCFDTSRLQAIPLERWGRKSHSIYIWCVCGYYDFPLRGRDGATEKKEKKGGLDPPSFLEAAAGHIC